MIGVSNANRCFDQERTLKAGERTFRHLLQFRTWAAGSRSAALLAGTLHSTVDIPFLFITLRVARQFLIYIRQGNQEPVPPSAAAWSACPFVGYCGFSQ